MATGSTDLHTNSRTPQTGHHSSNSSDSKSKVYIDHKSETFSLSLGNIFLFLYWHTQYNGKTI